MSWLSRNDIKVTIKLLDSENTFARATVILFDYLEIHGWRVMKSSRMHPRFQENIWIQGPSYKTVAGWKEIVFITDRNSWELVHEMIYDTFHMARSKKEGSEGLQSEKTNLTNEEVNPDEIPL